MTYCPLLQRRHLPTRLLRIIFLMKLTAFLVLVASLQVSVKAFSQERITMHLTNVKLAEALKTIEKESSFRFVYSPTLVPVNKSISINAQDQLVSEVVEKLFKGTGLSVSITKNSLVTIGRSARQENVLVSGTVRDASGVPLPGVTVSVKGQSGIGTASAENGQYRISAPQNGVLVFSLVGYEMIEQPLSANDEQQIDLIMAPAIGQLEEVAVVGYTRKKIAEISSSVSVVSGAKLNDVTSNNINTLLQGKAPGIVVSNPGGNPNEESSIFIRGAGSITANAAPLYIVDGIIGGVANPNDVESVTILKDVAGTGLYGSRASNGVIIINTNNGTTGGTRITYHGSVGLNQITQGNFRMMNSQELYNYQKSFIPAQQFEIIRPASLLDQQTNWVDLAFRNGITHNHTLSISAGNERTQFYTSGNFYNEEGTLRHNELKQYNFRTNLTHRINDKLKLFVRLNARSRSGENEAAGGAGALYGAYSNMPWDNPYNEDGSVKVGTESGWIGREKDNFLHGWQYNFDTYHNLNLSGDINLEYRILPTLTASSYNRIDYSNRKGEQYYDVRSKAGLGKGRLGNSFEFAQHLITSNRLTYINSFGNHNLQLLGVLEGERNKMEISNRLGQGLAPGLHSFNSVSEILRPAENPGFTTENAFTKGLIQADYNYNNRYYLVASYVNETSSRFGANNRSASFYTFGASWAIGNENFMQNQQVANQLKLRASYGSTGNAEIGDYQSLGLYTFASQYVGNAGAYPFQLANNNLTWERSNMLNIGLDAELFKRISLTVDVYNKVNKALLLEVDIPYTSGFSSVMKNIGSVRNRGLEMNIHSRNIGGQNFSWETEFNIAFNRSKILALNEGKDIILSNNIFRVGEDLNTWYFRKWVGVDPQNGDPLWEKVSTDANGNTAREATNRYSDATLQMVGSASPKFTGGILNSFSYKRFTLNAFLNFVYGNDIYHSSRRYYDSDGSYQTYNSQAPIDGWNVWKQAGDKATHPKPVDGGNKLSNEPSSRYLEDGSFLRLRNVSLAYSFPESMLQRSKVKNFKVFLSGDNIWTASRFSGMDPEVTLGVATGSSSFKYPLSRKFVLGVTMGF